MGWLGDLLKGVAGGPPEDFVFIDDLPFPDLNTQQPITPGEHYVELYVERARIEKGRSFTQKFHGVVYSFVKLAQLGEETALIPAISKPQKLAELDANSLGKVITVSKQMMGSVPWRGGPFGLELGLFSVKSGNILTPIVNFVTKVSETAGISFVGAVKPFVPLLTDGMDLLTGQGADVKLQVGVDTDLTVSHPMACAIIAARKHEVPRAQLRVDGSGDLLLNDQPLPFGYCVFTIRSSTQKADFGTIPELKEAFGALRDAARKGEKEAAGEALVTFRRTALFSPDLIQKDAERLAEIAQSLFDAAFPQAHVTRSVRSNRKAVPAAKMIPDSLAQLPLYKPAQRNRRRILL